MMNFFEEGINKVKQSTTQSGKEIQINNYHLVEEEQISEGGYGFIIKWIDKNTGKRFVLKKSIWQTEERRKVAEAECKFLTSVTDYTNIVQCFGVKLVKENGTDVFYALLELMTEGSLFDLMEKKQHTKLDEPTCLRIFRQIWQGVYIMHHMNPPLAHRDLKIENILFNGTSFKLCDFGSISSETIDFKNIPREDYESTVEEFDKKTTITYRPPEM